MAGLSKRKVHVGTHEIAYLEGGKGETILLLHGFSANKDNWIRFSKHLTDEYHVVAIDVPGFGESSRIKEEFYDSTTQTLRLRCIVNTLKIGQFHLVGHSMGGKIAGKFAADYPDDLLSLTLIGTGGIPTSVKSELTKRFDKGENPFNIHTIEEFDRFLEFEFVKVHWIPKLVRVRPEMANLPNFFVCLKI